MRIKVKKAIKIRDGEHVGVIFNIRYRREPFEYADIEIEFDNDGEKAKIKVGYPTMITINTKLGLLLQRFGENIVEGEEVDPDKVLIGKKCCFRTTTEVNEKGKFAKIDPDSVRPGLPRQGKLE
jgi:hypothetical protein